MCKLMDDLVKDVVKDEKLEMAKDAIIRGKLSHEDIAETCKLPLSTVEELASQIPKEA